MINCFILPWFVRFALVLWWQCHYGLAILFCMCCFVFISCYIFVHLLLSTGPLSMMSLVRIICWLLRYWAHPIVNDVFTQAQIHSWMAAMGASVSVCYRSILFVFFLICFGPVLLVHQIIHLGLGATLCLLVSTISRLVYNVPLLLRLPLFLLKFDWSIFFVWLFVINAG